MARQKLEPNFKLEVHKSEARNYESFFTKAWARLGFDDFRLNPPLKEDLKSKDAFGKS